MEELRAAVNAIEPGAVPAALCVASMRWPNPWGFLTGLQRESVGFGIMHKHLRGFSRKDLWTVPEKERWLGSCDRRSIGTN
eukprot:6962673-Karenia_brevis.AAC.2